MNITQMFYYRPFFKGKDHFIGKKKGIKSTIMLSHNCYCYASLKVIYGKKHSIYQTFSTLNKACKL